VSSVADLATVVVSWRSAADVLRLAAAFPADRRHELVVVDNAGESELDAVSAGNVRLLRPGGNLGFGGGSNAGARAASAASLLFLNPDATPQGDAFDSVLEGLMRRPDAAGIVPRLVGENGAPQYRWQLRDLPRPAALLAHAFFWNPGGARREPAAGEAIGQPAAAALALRREIFEELGGFDDRYAPAWFEDVDLARRLATAGRRLLYWPEATFRHRIGSSVGELGYGRFLRVYDRNLARYLRQHHGRGWELAFRIMVPFGALARLTLLPIRRPLRARSRGEAAAALIGAGRAALGGWRKPEGSA
jgi:N-acetylglucosaminyl-diphospho-decaprenol L-rhamnosyltransferase